MEILIICSTIVILTVAVLLFVFYSRPYEDVITQRDQFHTREGVYYKEIQTIERRYANGAKKIITKHIRY